MISFVLDLVAIASAIALPSRRIGSLLMRPEIHEIEGEDLSLDRR